MDRSENALYYTSVIGLSAQDAVLGGFLYCEGHEPSITRVSMIHGGQGFHLYDLDDVVSSTDWVPGHDGAPGTLCFLGRGGLLREQTRGQSPIDSQVQSKVGYLLGLRSIGGRLYACGTQRQLLRREAGTWVDHDEGLYRPLVDQVDATLRALDGFAEDDIYAVGMHGHIWHWDGQRWSQLESQSTWMLNAVLCAPDGQVYAGGVAGTLLQGSARDGWRRIDGMALDQSIESLAWFGGQLYAAAQGQLLIWDGARLSEVETGVAGEQAFFALHACEQALWSVGNTCVLSFDGTTWVRHQAPT
ncbi:MAG: hypothetical protein ACN6O6_08500 [Pseudomonas sp.]|uniref:hypothetical protein n=1 Tax=Pseudomonas sp. TaxID=306 RepID=UPI003D1480C7